MLSGTLFRIDVGKIAPDELRDQWDLLRLSLRRSLRRTPNPGLTFPLLFFILRCHPVLLRAPVPPPSIARDQQCDP